MTARKKRGDEAEAILRDLLEAMETLHSRKASEPWSRAMQFLGRKSEAPK